MGGRISLEGEMVSTIDHIEAWLLRISVVKQLSTAAAATAMEGQQLAVAVRCGKECLAWDVTYGQDPDGVDGELVGLCVTHLGRLFLEFKNWSGYGWDRGVLEGEREVEDAKRGTSSRRRGEGGKEEGRAGRAGPVKWLSLSLGSVAGVEGREGLPPCSFLLRGFVLLL